MTYRRNTQPYGERLSRAVREQQIRDGIAHGLTTLADLAAAMRCSGTLVPTYAKTMSDVRIEPARVMTKAGFRTRAVLSIAERAA